jgi:hypothetical protein
MASSGSQRLPARPLTTVHVGQVAPAPPAPLRRSLALTAERWEDDTPALVLRLALAEVLAPQLESLRLVATDSGRATSAFLAGGSCLRELRLDFWGRSSGLPRAAAACTALTRLCVQCSAGLGEWKALTALTSLQVCTPQPVMLAARELPLGTQSART